MNTPRKPYFSDVSDPEWEFLLPYLTLMGQDAPQRQHDLREVFNALRYVVRTGGQWRYLPNDFPPWTAVYQQARRWVQAGVFESIAHDLREALRQTQGRAAQPSAATRGPCNPRQRAAPARDTTGTRRRTAPRSTSPSTRLRICWPSP
jgi:transposase